MRLTIENLVVHEHTKTIGHLIFTNIITMERTSFVIDRTLTSSEEIHSLSVQSAWKRFWFLQIRLFVCAQELTYSHFDNSIYGHYESLLRFQESISSSWFIQQKSISKAIPLHPERQEHLAYYETFIYFTVTLCSWLTRSMDFQSFAWLKKKLSPLGQTHSKINVN